MRLNKALAQAGVASRRRADELVFAGRVSVNGQVVITPGIQIDPTTAVLAVDGKTVQPWIEAPDAASDDSSPSAGELFQPSGGHTYYVLNKPVQVVSTVSDPQGRQTVLELLPPALRAGRRLYPVGRLDYFSEGLILLTDDGELTHRLTHPRHHLPKKYEVLVRGVADARILEAMRSGMTLAEGETLAPVEARIMSRPAQDKAWLSLTLVQGVNRQIRRMCRDLQLTILRLVRVQEGPVLLGNLPKGQARPLTEREIRALRESVGLLG